MDSRRRMMSGEDSPLVTFDLGNYWKEYDGGYGKGYYSFECNVKGATSAERVTRSMRINYLKNCKITVYIQNYNFQSTTADNYSYGMIGKLGVAMTTSVTYTSSGYVLNHTRGVNSTTSTALSSFKNNTFEVIGEGFIDVGAKLYSYTGYVRCVVYVEKIAPFWYDLETVYLSGDGTVMELANNSTYNPDLNKWDCYIFYNSSAVTAKRVRHIRFTFKDSYMFPIIFSAHTSGYTINIGKTGEPLVCNGTTVSNYRYYDRTYEGQTDNTGYHESAGVFTSKSEDFVDVAVETYNNSYIQRILVLKNRPEQFDFKVDNVDSYKVYPAICYQDDSCNPLTDTHVGFLLRCRNSAKTAEILRLHLSGYREIYAKSENSAYNVRLSAKNEYMSLSGAGVTGHSYEVKASTSGCTLSDFTKFTYTGDEYTVDIGFLAYDTNKDSYILIPKQAKDPDATEYTVSGWSTYSSAPTGYNGWFATATDSNYTKAIIRFRNMPNFTCYIRSYAESRWDYVVISKLDTTLDSSPDANDTSVQAHTSGNQQSGTSLSNYTKVVYDNDGGEHFVEIAYLKDFSDEYGNDEGYLLIPKL